MNALRRLPLSRLLALSGGVVVLGASGALAASAGQGPKPAPKPLAAAVHDALAAAPVQGVSANVTFTNLLLASGSLTGGASLLSGGSGRLWASDRGQVRLELQSDSGDTEVVYDGSTVSYLDPASKTLYRLAPPKPAGHGDGAPGAHPVPAMQRIQQVLGQIATHVNLSGATPDDVAGQPAYRVQVSPASNGGLVGGAALWWDAMHGVPLRLAVYDTSRPNPATGRPDPVLELTATQITYGAVDGSVFATPHAAKTIVVQTPARHASATSNSSHHVSGVAAVQAAVPFTLAAPATLEQRSLTGARLLELSGHPAALVSYGHGLASIMVLEQQADRKGIAPSSSPVDGTQGNSLPKVSIGAAKATVIPTALGTLVRFQRGGVSYTVVGSVTTAVAEAAARGL